MKIVERGFDVENRSQTFHLYAIGDVHMGALNCAEGELRKLVRRIAEDPNSYWLGGGDLCDAVILNDSKRFDPDVLPDWMLEGGATKVRLNIKDMLDAQRKRLLKILEPIKERCLGLIEGNHEYSIMKHHNRNHQAEFCEMMGAEDLTDCAFVRLKFNRGAAVKTVKVFICHGTGGGRTPGAEPNKLFRMAQDKDCDILFTGHSHTFNILPPITILGIPSKGALPADPAVRDKHVANWGAYVYTYASGPSTYASRACYPVRPMYTVDTVIRPHYGDYYMPEITMSEVKLQLQPRVMPGGLRPEQMVDRSFELPDDEL